jgi:hypothetical protein
VDVLVLHDFKRDPVLFTVLKFIVAPGTLTPSYSTLIINVAGSSVNTIVYSGVSPGTKVMLTEHDSRHDVPSVGVTVAVKFTLLVSDGENRHFPSIEVRHVLTTVLGDSLAKMFTCTPGTGLPAFKTLMMASLGIGTNTTVYSGISPGFIVISTKHVPLQMVPFMGMTVALYSKMPSTDETAHFPSREVLQVCATVLGVWLNAISTCAPGTGLPSMTTLTIAVLGIGSNITVYSGISPGFIVMSTEQESLQV